MAKRKREVADGAQTAKALKSRKEELASRPKPTAASKRKEAAAANGEAAAAVNGESAVNGQAVAGSAAAREGNGDTTTFQIITGSYERVLHGFTAAIPHSLITGPDSTTDEDQPKIAFSDTFLFNAHASAIRCLALSPPSSEASKVLLATGSTDERINIYSLSKSPPVPSKTKPILPSLHGNSITENSKNKEMGSLLHHSSSVTALCFPIRSKLLSASEDSTIAITRTRDWEPLSTIKAPIPKAQGRPSGDTAAPGEVPSGINDFAIHPSMKLMVSVSKGEKCMRLWNLITGKKAGVLNFGKDILASVGEGRFASGEGKNVVWDATGVEFAVAFERGAVVFDMDCRPKAKVLPSPRTKVHQMCYLQSEEHAATLMVATEDGRIMLYDTNSTTAPSADNAKDDDIPSCNLIAQIGGPAAGITGRVKEFEVLPLSDEAGSGLFLIIAGSSDGAVRLWRLDAKDLLAAAGVEKGKGFTAKQVGRLLGTYSTGTRITCLKAFEMTGKPDEAEEDDDEAEVVANEKSDGSSSDEESE
ncbi:WD40 repeat-like protein [Massarina eburnea CBS 473.64]|uniref:WD40 repeat-like protein n=1 Tax=Massarina eburnea CBS 473.64 TaxID=1395130 RepID=A0A6A6S987_9PLEO|nr:WD40 repeat-like protein [Massarina eburnea CBS 473.64]